MRDKLDADADADADAVEVGVKRSGTGPSGLTAYAGYVRLLLQGRYEYFMQYYAARPVFGALLHRLSDIWATFGRERRKPAARVSLTRGSCWALASAAMSSCSSRSKASAIVPRCSSQR